MDGCLLADFVVIFLPLQCYNYVAICWHVNYRWRLKVVIMDGCMRALLQRL
jgi:hypothetical protein